MAASISTVTQGTTATASMGRLGDTLSNNDIQSIFTIPMIQILARNNAIISSVFDSNAMWVRSVPAPRR